MPNAELIVIPSVWGHFAGGPGTNPADVAFVDAKLRELKLFSVAVRAVQRLPRRLFRCGSHGAMFDTRLAATRPFAALAIGCASNIRCAHGSLELNRREDPLRGPSTIGTFPIDTCLGEIQAALERPAICAREFIYRHEDAPLQQT